MAIGGVIRNDKGVVLGAMAMKLSGKYDPYIAECMAIRQGLWFANEAGLLIDIVESDSLNAVNAIKRRDEFSLESQIIDDFVFMLSISIGGTCCYVSRNGNKATHTLACFVLS